MQPSNPKQLMSLQVSSIGVPPGKKEASVPKRVPLFGSYFTAAYYLRVFPYQMHYDADRKWWMLKTSNLHLVTCVLLTWIPCIIWRGLFLFNDSRKFSMMSKRSANAYFEICYQYLNQFACVYVLWNFACRKKEMELIINSCAKILAINYNSLRLVKIFGTFDGSGRNTAKILNAAIKRAHVYFAIVGLLYFGMNIGTVFFANQGGVVDYPRSVLQIRIIRAREWLFLATPSNAETNATGIEFSAENVILGVVYNFGCLAWNLVNIVLEMGLMVPYPLTLWLAAKKFEMFLNLDCIETEQTRGGAADVDVGEFGERYEELKQFSDLLNASWGKMNFLWHLSACLRTIFDAHLHNRAAWSLSRSLGLLVVLMQVTWQTVTIVFSADVFVKMKRVRRWLTFTKIWAKFWMSESRSQVERIYMELQDGPIGVSYEGIYHCTYGFIAQLLAFIITIFVVTFQTD